MATETPAARNDRHCCRFENLTTACTFHDDERTSSLRRVEQFVAGIKLPGFSAGSHVYVMLPDGVPRQYPLCNNPVECHPYCIAVSRDPASRGGLITMHEQVQVGDVITIGAPRNHFPLAHEAGRSPLVAGGIGITPILCLAERLLAVGAGFELHYCTRSQNCTAFRRRIVASPYAANVPFHFDDGDTA